MITAARRSVKEAGDSVERAVLSTRPAIGTWGTGRTMPGRYTGEEWSSRRDLDVPGTGGTPYLRCLRRAETGVVDAE